MSPESLLLAYQFGIFPWTDKPDPILWWYTHPRCVLFPNELRITKSMKSYLNQDRFRCTMDTAFEEVMDQCQKVKRKGQNGTWIFAELKAAFIELHRRGYAHSVEVWDGQALVGGLYGMALGKIFYGESMFAKQSNASKFGFIKLVQWLNANEFWLIDCQQRTQHILSLGAETISGKRFFETLKRNTLEPSLKGKWKF